MSITYQVGRELELDEMLALYHDSTLGERRPVADRDRMAKMLANANLIVTAWDGAKLVGISRALSDFAYVTYLSDLAVHRAYQRQGIGRELLRQTLAAGGQAKVVLLAAPDARPYYPHVGLTQHPSAWTLDSEEALQ